MTLINKSIDELHELYKTKQVSVEEVALSCLDRIDKTDSDLNAFSYVSRDEVLKKAKDLDAQGMNENSSKLWGIPIAIKDNMCVKGFPTTAGSKILENFISPYDGAMANILKENDALIIGSCTMDEFAMGSSSETNAFKTPKNPYSLDRVPGGSSGGSAISVSANQVICSLGSDTGGSIRLPASFCGVVGMKPTYGLVSRFGLIAYASSFDQIGPFARNVKDAAILLQSIVKHDVRDSTSFKHKNFDYISSLDKDIKDLKIGIPKEYFTEGLESEVKKSIDESIKVLENLGAIVKEVNLPNTEYAVSAYYILATAEASANLARYDGVKYGFRAKDIENLEEMYLKSRTFGFGMEVKRRIILGTFVLSSGYYDAYYLKAQKARTVIKNDFLNAFKEVDVLLTPTSPFTAFKVGEKMNDPVSMYLSDIYTVSVNLAGLPAISIPAGFDSKNLPIGMQLIAPHLKEELLLNVAYQFEQNNNASKAEICV